MSTTRFENTEKQLGTPPKNPIRAAVEKDKAAGQMRTLLDITPEKAIEMARLTRRDVTEDVLIVKLDEFNLQVKNNLPGGPVSKRLLEYLLKLPKIKPQSGLIAVDEEQTA
jgi:hypothetical protein